MVTQEPETKIRVFSLVFVSCSSQQRRGVRLWSLTIINTKWFRRSFTPQKDINGGCVRLSCDCSPFGNTMICVFSALISKITSHYHVLIVSKWRNTKGSCFRSNQTSPQRRVDFWAPSPFVDDEDAAAHLLQTGCNKYTFFCQWLALLLPIHEGILQNQVPTYIPIYLPYSHSQAHSYTSFGKSHLTTWSVFDGWQLWFTERPLRNHVFTLFHHVSHASHRETDVRSFLVHPSIHAHRHSWIRSFVHNTCELRGLLLAPGERREAQEAGEANLDGPLSPGLTPLPGLPGWAAAAGWKKSAGRWKTGEDPPPPPLQLPLSPSEKTVIV